MGGDLAPLEAVKGVRQYLAQSPEAHLLLLGDEAQVAPLLAEHDLPAGAYTFVHTPQVIDMHEHPTKALREKQRSSIAVGFHLLATDKIDAFISAGNTGAMLVGSLYSLKPLEGILRPTISTIIPKENGGTGLLLDVGLNSDCKPEQLNQFARMGSIYAETILGIENPRAALLNIGEEESKGNLLAQAAYPLLKSNPALNFTGNVEGRDILLNRADVMVCDGFTGNIILKLCESLFGITQQKGIDHDYFQRFNFENYGGTPVLGISKPVIIGHGISREHAFHNMILLAQKMIYTGVMQQMSI
ncbi:phosphate acyltransferase PlsX [Flaviaesturariibacter amylovorans]|uniref:Phosphate acyltransferase n=2 Tax=Flaviaesturariibacter amylovorans TaxID=1084520 RepID=A0ABP8GQ60_9BACT